jgi:hypothetical protein
MAEMNIRTQQILIYWSDEKYALFNGSRVTDIHSGKMNADKTMLEEVT